MREEDRCKPVFFYWGNVNIDYVYCGGRHAKIVIIQGTDCWGRCYSS